MNTNDLYSPAVQEMLFRYMITNVDAFLIARGIIKPEYFHDKLRPAVRFILEHTEKGRPMPTPDMIEAYAGVRYGLFDDPHLHYDWFMENIEGFARYKALALTIVEGIGLLDKGEGGEVERRVKEAMSISLQTDLGTSYFHDPLGRLERMRDRSQYVSTGWKTLDDKLLGGFTPGALNVWAGGSGSGKSIWLQNIAINWVLAGKNVIYFSLELSEDLVSMRLDAMMTGRGTKDVIKDIQGTAMAIKTRQRKANAEGVRPGTLIVKKMPEAGTTANDIRGFLKEYEIKNGIKPDAIVIDYLDLMHPNNRKIDPTNAFAKDKYTSEEMRALAGEYGALCATASQLNRQSVEATEFDHSHIAGGISKINTADNVFGIFTSQVMRERGAYQIQFLKTRSSSAVGSKIELAYDPISMRIRDVDAGDEAVRPHSTDEQRDTIRQVTQNIAGQRAVSAPRSDTRALLTEAAEEPPTIPGNDIKNLMSKIKSSGRDV